MDNIDKEFEEFRRSIAEEVASDESLPTVLERILNDPNVHKDFKAALKGLMKDELKKMFKERMDEELDKMLLESNLKKGDNA